MGKKARRNPTAASASASPASPWSYVLTAIAAAAIGAVIAVSVSPRHTAAAKVAAPAPAPSSTPAAPAQQVPPVPPPQITVGLSPEKVALNLGNWSYDQQNWASAIAYYNEAIRRGIDNPDIRTDLGNAYRFNNDLTTALSEYQAAQKQNPKHENSLFNQGGVYALLGKPEKAVAVWQDYLKRFPNGEHKADANDLISTTQAHAGLTTGTGKP